MDTNEKPLRPPHPNDLTRPIDAEAVQNRGRQPTNVIAVDELRSPLYLNEPILGDRLSRRVKADQARFERLINHAPSVGAFYESLLKDLLNEIKPATLSIGTGFVYDYEEETHSPQLDIIVYNESRRAALYRKGDFIVVERAEVVSVAEVKKTLTLTELRAVIKKTINCRFGTPGYVSPSQEMVIITSVR